MGNITRLLGPHGQRVRAEVFLLDFDLRPMGFQDLREASSAINHFEDAFLNELRVGDAMPILGRADLEDFFEVA